MTDPEFSFQLAVVDFVKIHSRNYHIRRSVYWLGRDSSNAVRRQNPPQLVGMDASAKNFVLTNVWTIT